MTSQNVIRNSKHNFALAAAALKFLVAANCKIALSREACRELLVSYNASSVGKRSSRVGLVENYCIINYQVMSPRGGPDRGDPCRSRFVARFKRIYIRNRHVPDGAPFPGFCGRSARCSRRGLPRQKWSSRVGRLAIIAYDTEHREAKVRLSRGTSGNYCI